MIGNANEREDCLSRTTGQVRTRRSVDAALPVRA